MLAGARVLVADDDEDVLAVVSETLERLGGHVMRAQNGAELIEHIADHGPFDLIVTDVGMPWMTGLRAIHAARTAGVGTSVIVMSGLTDPSLPSRVKALGARAAFLRKPFELAELESLAATLLAVRPAEP